MTTRTEHDTMGSIEVPNDRYWGAQTERSLGNFPIGHDRFGRSVIWALGTVKKACAEVNRDLDKLDSGLADAIVAACDEVIAGNLDDHFPLKVWQTGSGTQTNMNANEVIANRAIESLGGALGSQYPIHPNDHVNLGQSSNDVFPTVMHVAAAERIHTRLVPAVIKLRATLNTKAEAFEDVIKVGRTHLQDATPLTLGAELSGHAAQLDLGLKTLHNALSPLHELAIGGTAVGTGLNTHPEFGERVAARIAELTGRPFVSAPNKYAALASHEPIVVASSACKSLAVALMKIANDIRWLASGPRCGIGEIEIPQNEPGSSIMPGKVNPTQAEALTMVCCQVMGNDVAITIAASQGSFELNAFKPVLIFNLLGSIRLLADACQSFNERCAAGIQPNLERIEAYLDQTLMLATGLTPLIGYDKAAEVAKKALDENKSLRKAVLELGYLDGEAFDRATDPKAMLGPKV